MKKTILLLSFCLTIGLSSYASIKSTLSEGEPVGVHFIDIKK